MIELGTIHIALPPITWSGICLGMIIMAAVLVALVLYWGREKPETESDAVSTAPADGGIPFGVIATLGSDDAEEP